VPELIKYEKYEISTSAVKQCSGLKYGKGFVRVYSMLAGS